MKDFKENQNVVKVIRKRRSKRNLIRCGLTLPFLTYLSLWGIAAFGVIPFATVLSSTAMFTSIFYVSSNSKPEYRKKTKDFLTELSKDIARFNGEPSWRINSLDNITIIPKNVKVGENLEALNAVPIFKKGKYIIIEGNHSVEILAQYKENDKDVVKILDEYEVEEEYNALDEKTKHKVHRENKLLSYILKD